MLCSGVDRSRFYPNVQLLKQAKDKHSISYTLKQPKCQKKSLAKRRRAEVWFSFTVNVALLSSTGHALDTGDADPDLTQSQASDLILRNM